jgi:hypothetical protein
MVSQEVLEELILTYKDVPNSRDFIMLCFTAFPDYTQNKFKGLINRTLNQISSKLEISSEFMLKKADSMSKIAKKSIDTSYSNYIEYKRFRSEYICLSHFIKNNN